MVLYPNTCKLAIQEALCRELLGGWTPGADALLSIEDGPPPQALVARLKDLKRAIRPTVGMSQDDEAHFIDPATGNRVVTCRISGIRWVNPITVNVEASAASGLMGGSGAVYILRWTPWEGWTVVGRQGQWVS